ncbi:MAG: Gldg family protein [Pirellulaceae bacterium]|nr:Gldg family protein [Pirellulaceae bacterium]
MLSIDVIFLSILMLATVVLLLLPKFKFRSAAFAVMQRNFVGYFSNPTGYVFLCLFCVLAAVAAFWPHEFFTSNLANFDQLNIYLPYIMLIFIPAITMAIWAEEKRQGTDELLLTLPATDYDVVLGKYLAALFVFTVSLVFSEICNYSFLAYITEGQLDSGLLSATYLGYWFVGVAMISLGMVASFLTNNLTVGFIFGAVLNAPLAFLSNVDVIVSGNELVGELSAWGYLSRFETFGRGVIGIAPMIYFIGIAVIGLYLSLVLIGRRHWIGGKDGSSTIWHYLVRVPMIVVIVVAMTLIVQNSGLNRGLRYDASEGKVSSLLPKTLEILQEINSNEGEYSEIQNPIVIDAFVGNNIPPKYARTKFEVISLLREFSTIGDKRIRLNLNLSVDPVSEEASIARKSFGIRAQEVESNARGSNRRDQVILGATVTCGLERVAVPFFFDGMNVEHELIRAIRTVAKPERKIVGVLGTIAAPAGGAITTNQGRVRIPKSEFVKSIEKQYKVENVDASEPIRVWIEEDGEDRLRYDVLLVEQPSTLNPEQLLFLMDAIKQGQPTAVFEDPYAVYEPRFRNSYLNYAGGCNINELWNLLGLQLDMDLTGAQADLRRQGKEPVTVVWQDYNPYPSLDEFSDVLEAIFFSKNAPGASDVALNSESDITRGLEEVFGYTAGVIRRREEHDLDFIPLLAVGTQSGTTPVVAFYDENQSIAGLRRREEEAAPKASAVQIQGELPTAYKTLRTLGMKGSDYVPAALSNGNRLTVNGFSGVVTGVESGQVEVLGENDESRKFPVSMVTLDFPDINVVYVADTDIISDFSFRMCDQPDYKNAELRFQNNVFALNVIDALAGDKELIDIRVRQQKHKTLRRIEKETYNFKKEVLDATNRANKLFNEEFAKAEANYNAILRKYQEQLEKSDAESRSTAARLKIQLDSSNRTLKVRQEILTREKEEAIAEAENRKELKVRRIQSVFRWYSAVIPIIVPSLLGLLVFSWRRMREREGMSKARIRK